MSDKQYFVVWYENWNKPYKINAQLLDDFDDIDCKYVEFPAPNGEMGTWKRSMWIGTSLRNDETAYDQKTPYKVSELADITMYLVANHAEYLDRRIADMTNEYEKICNWLK